MELILGARHIDRVISGVEDLLLQYRGDIGYEYLKYAPLIPSNILVPEDLAVTLLVNSRASVKAFQSLQKHGKDIKLDELPMGPLEQISDTEISILAEAIAKVASWPGIAASVATKVLHKKRPDLIPILDNQAIFGAYMNRDWPEKRSSDESIKDQIRIEEALRWIKIDLTRPENEKTWISLKENEPSLSLIEVFDCVWWEHFRTNELVAIRTD